jgi:hypothetical protein
MVPLPNLFIDLVSGLLGGCSTVPFLFTGLTQYRLKIPSDNHCIRERCNDAARMADSAMDWYSSGEGSRACGCLVTGRGFDGTTLVGRVASAGGEDASRGVGVRTVLLRLVYFLF